jgi:hypothetical protein
VLIQRLLNVVYHFLCQVARMGVVQLLDQGYSLVIQLLLLNFHLSEDIDS